MRSAHGNSGSEKDHSHLQRAFTALGYIYRTLEDELNALGAASGGVLTARDAALWMANTLRAKCQAGGFVLDGAESMSALRRGSAAGDAFGASAAALHVRPRRILSPQAIAAISEAQRQRWAKFHKTAKGKLSKRAGWRTKSAAARQKSTQAVARALGNKGSVAMKSFWSSMTPEQRSAEMVRRREVAAAKKKVKAEAA